MKKTRKSAPYSGNRLPVPSSIRSQHLFYQTAAVRCSSASLDRLAHLVTPYLRARAIADHIEVVDRRGLVLECGQAAGVAWDRVLASLPAFVKQSAEDFEILACEWAGLHVDPGFAGVAFYSVVLRTGPFGYRMQTVYTKRRIEGRDELTQIVASTRKLEVGDAFVVDPTTPHMVLPERPHVDQLLILFQAKLPDSDSEDRDKLVRNLRPDPDDHDYTPPIYGTSGGNYP